MVDSTHELIEHLTDAVRAPERLDLDFDACRVRVRSNSRTLMERLAYYFKDFIGSTEVPDVTVLAVEAEPLVPDVPFVEKEPEPGKTKVKEAYADLPDGRVVRKLQTGMLFLMSGERNVAYGACVENWNQVINFIGNRFTQRYLDGGHLLGHASAVAFGGDAVVVAAGSGMGKSTLALHLMGLGGSYVSNDRVLMGHEDGGTVVIGVPKLPRVNPGTIVNNPLLEDMLPPNERRRLRALPRDELWRLEEKHDVYIDQRFGPARYTLRARLGALVILDWRRGDAAPVRLDEVRLEERPELLTGLMKAPGVFYRPSPGHAGEPDARAYLGALKHVAVFVAGGGVDFERAADLVRSSLVHERAAPRGRAPVRP